MRIPKDDRRRELARMTKTRLVRMCGAGIHRPDGGLSYIEGGMYPLSQWRKDEIIEAILRAEYAEGPDR